MGIERFLKYCVKKTVFFTQKIQKQEKGEIEGGLSDFYTKKKYYFQYSIVRNLTIFVSII
ncbi:hypothetical protein DWV37_13820 [Tannerella sp. AF04-6]|nr:hypothetical protein DWV37_13820 [Tannerella sp. AF04-6]